MTELAAHRHIIHAGNAPLLRDSFIRLEAAKYLSSKQISQLILGNVLRDILEEDERFFARLPLLRAHFHTVQAQQEAHRLVQTSQRHLLLRLAHESTTFELPFGLRQGLDSVRQRIAQRDWTDYDQYASSYREWSYNRKLVSQEMKRKPWLFRAYTFRLPMKVEEQLNQEWQTHIQRSFIWQ